MEQNNDNINNNNPAKNTDLFNFEISQEDNYEFTLPKDCEITPEGLEEIKRVSFDTTRNEYFTVERKDSENELFEEDEEEIHSFEIEIDGNQVFSSKIEHEGPSGFEEGNNEQKFLVLEKVLQENNDFNNDNNSFNENNINNDNSFNDNSFNDSVSNSINISDISNSINISDNKIVENISNDVINDVSNDVSNNISTDSNKSNSNDIAKDAVEQNLCDFISKIKIDDKLNQEIVFSDEKCVIVEKISKISNNPFILQDRMNKKL